jgi:prepilin-type N-terminal cleavage/methylation domain-containing protein
METNTKRGFTLIELLIVVAIIGLLASVVLIGLGTFRSTGRDARRVADLRQVQSALELYFAPCGFYPGDAITAGACPVAFVQSADGLFRKGPPNLPGVLTGSGIGVLNIPDDPLGSQSYGYFTTANGAGYILAATLEDPNSASLKNDIDGNAGGGFPNLPPDGCGVPATDTVYCIGL